MGCGTSKLKGDSFEGVNSTVCAPPPRVEPQNSTPSIGETFPSGGTHSFRAVLHADKEKLSSSRAASSPSPSPPANSSNPPQREGLRNGSNMLSTLREQWKNRKGVPEPRDPVTGRGLHTGLTIEELKQHVGNTRPAGSPESAANYIPT